MEGEKVLTAEQAQSEWDKLAIETDAASAPSESEFTKKTAAEAPEEEAPAGDENVDVDPASVDPDVADAEDADPYAGLSPALKARLEKLDASLAKTVELEQKVKTAEGRVAAMQREQDVAKNAAKTVGSAPSTAQIDSARADTGKWDALKTDFPEWADATEQLLAARLAGLKPSETKGLSPTEVAALVDKAVEESKVDAKHPDFKDAILATPEFGTWYAAQDDKVKALGASVKAKDAISLLDMYAEAQKTSATEIAAGRKNKLAAAVNAKPGQSAATPGKHVDQMTEKELWDFEAKRAAKKNAGRGLAY